MVAQLFIKNKMKIKVASVIATILFYSSVVAAQVQVSKESLHKNVLENKLKTLAVNTIQLLKNEYRLN